MTVVRKLNVVYILPDKMGGVFSLNRNLIQYSQRADNFSFTQAAVLTDNLDSLAARSSRQFVGCQTTQFTYSAHENYYAVLKRLRRRIPNGPGVLVSNDALELAMLCRYDVNRMAVHIVHNDYNLSLTYSYAPVIDVFITYSRFHDEKLHAALPDRASSIVYLPYGVPLPVTVRRPKSGPLRLLFTGRLAASKGIFDLPLIDRILRDAQVSVEWTIIGDGPDRQALYEQWQASHIQYYGMQTSDFVMAQCAQHDLFIFPSRSEGFPVALLEAMGAGLVPIASDLPSGVPEVVTDATGFRLPIGAVADFAATIMALDRDRERLEQMSRASRQLIEEHFDVRQRVLDYQTLFAEYATLRRPRPRTMPLPSHSRLDQPWLPNWLVMLARHLRQRL